MANDRREQMKVNLSMYYSDESIKEGPNPPEVINGQWVSREHD
jgi:hypothetical protein